MKSIYKVRRILFTRDNGKEYVNQVIIRFAEKMSDGPDVIWQLHKKVGLAASQNCVFFPAEWKNGFFEADAINGPAGGVEFVQLLPLQENKPAH